MDWDVIVIGAGAAGMMCAAVAGQRGRKVLVLEAAKAPGEKIRISGGGRCNFTNLRCRAGAIPVGQPALLHLGPQPLHPAGFHRVDRRYRIDWHEKILGQLFCDGSAGQVIDMLLAEMSAAGAQLRLGAKIQVVEKTLMVSRCSWRRAKC